MKPDKEQATHRPRVICQPRKGGLKIIGPTNKAKEGKVNVHTNTDSA